MPTTEVDLDPSLYDPSEEDVAFFKDQTGIQDDEELKQHIFAIQKEAWDVVPYRCIRLFSFLKLTIFRHPKYAEFLKLRDERHGAIFLELACFFGMDVRKAVLDGYPTENIVASDLEPAFWDLGHKFFKSTPETFPVKFVRADVLDPNHIAPRLPLYAPPTNPRPELKTLTSLTPLQGHVSAIHAGLFFHLFDEETQARAARALASLLSPEPGSMIFGHHLGMPVAGVSYNARSSKTVYRHSPETWAELWNGQVFEKGTVDVWSMLLEIDRADLVGDTKVHLLVWSVTRL